MEANSFTQLWQENTNFYGNVKDQLSNWIQLNLRNWLCQLLKVEHFFEMVYHVDMWICVKIFQIPFGNLESEEIFVFKSGRERLILH